MTTKRLIEACSFLLRQYDEVDEFTMGGKLTNKPFLAIKKAIKRAEHSYRVVEIERVVDGDTYWFHLDVGFRGRSLQPIRLLGYDCPENRGATVWEKEQAKRATNWAFNFCTLAISNRSLFVQTAEDPDSFGRWLGEVWDDDSGLVLGEELQREELATVWPQRWRDVYGEGGVQE